MDKSLKTALIVGGIVLVVLAVVPAIIGAFTGWRGGGWGWGMMGPGMMGGFGFMGWMPIVWIVVLGLIIWAVVAGVRGATWSGGSDSGRPDSALELLKKRYARSEISKEEYEEKKKDLA